MTMVEILVVIAIIAILIGLIVGGLAFSLRSSNASQTKAILADLNAMVAEAELIKPLPDFLQEPTLNGRPDLEPYGTQITVNGNTLTYVPQYLEVDVTKGDSRGFQPLDVPMGSGSLSPVASGSISTNIYIGTGTNIAAGTPSPAEVYTAYVLNKLLTLPKNQELFSKIPSTRFTQIAIAKPGIISTSYENPPGSGSYTPGSWPTSAMLSAAGGTLTLPVPLDAWGREIYFVPGGGLVNSNAASGMPLPSTGAGLLSGVQIGTATTSFPYGYAVGNGPVVSPTGKSFWASAGPDGVMLMGDDNIYSFTP
jgi:type II secretory pathway pseudopilin PulG